MVYRVLNKNDQNEIKEFLLFGVLSLPLFLRLTTSWHSFKPSPKLEKNAVKAPKNALQDYKNV